MYSVDVLDKGIIHVQGGTVREFNTLLRTVQNLKLLSLYFRNFPRKVPDQSEEQ